jgi:hypothetical protein
MSLSGIGFQRYKPKRIFQSRRTISEFIIDETFNTYSVSKHFNDLR